MSFMVILFKPKNSGPSSSHINLRPATWSKTCSNDLLPAWCPPELGDN